MKTFASFNFHKHKKNPMTQKNKTTNVEVVCPKCRHTEIVKIPRDISFPKCPKCNSNMLIKELLREGKSN